MPRASLTRVYLNRRMAALLLLGFSSGLPLGLTGATLQAWLTDAGVDLATIAALGLVWVPYSFKFLWSPVIDRYAPLPVLGRRRGWLLLTQVALGLAILGLAMAGVGSLKVLAAAALLIAFLSASQDIAADAYRTDVLPEAERGAGAGVFVTGYRLALLLATGLALIVVDRYEVTWQQAYVALAMCMGVGLVGTLIAPTPPGHSVERPQTLADAVVQPLRNFVRRRGWLVVLAFVVLFKASDEMLNGVRTTFLLRDVGFTKSQLGAIGNSFGLVMTIVGALAGGVVVARIGLARSLWLAVVLQTLSNLSFIVLTRTGPSYEALAAVVCIENLCGGLVAAAFVAYIMAQCDWRFSATQYALLSSLMAITRIGFGAPAGKLADALGWPMFFLASVAASIPALMLLPLLPTGQIRPDEDSGPAALARADATPTMGG